MQDIVISAATLRAMRLFGIICPPRPLTEERELRREINVLRRDLSEKYSQMRALRKRLGKGAKE